MSRIAERHQKYIEEIRWHELAQLSDEICELCRHYGVYEHEFTYLIKDIESSLYSLSEMLDSDEDEDEEDAL